MMSSPANLYPDDRMEHLFIPSSLGFMSVHFGHRPALEPYKVVNARRFTDQSAIKLRKKRISFNRKAALQMLEQATLLLFGDGEQPLHRGVPMPLPWIMNTWTSWPMGCSAGLSAWRMRPSPHLKAEGLPLAGLENLPPFWGRSQGFGCFPVDSKGTLPVMALESF